MIKILAHSPAPFDTTSFYRAYGVFPNLDKQLNRGLIVTPFRGGITWAEVAGYDVLFLQRPQSKALFDLATYAKSIGVKIWVDYDDNLFAIPNEKRAFFDIDAKVKGFMLQTLEAADAVSVSTEELKKFFETMKIENVEVIPNALNDEIHVPAEKYNADSKNIVWRGSETHVADIAYFSEQILEAITENSVDTWHFMGYNPWTITNVIPCFSQGINQNPEFKIHVHKSEDVKIYHENLQKLKPRIMHVPLVGNNLNFCKSNIAWIEATFAGAVTIAPNWPEWNRPGVICYDSQEDYLALLKNQSLDCAKCWGDSIKYIKENLTLTGVNKKRIAILSRLLDGEQQKFLETVDSINTLTESQTE